MQCRRVLGVTPHDADGDGSGASPAVLSSAELDVTPDTGSSATIVELQSGTDTDEMTVVTTAVVVDLSDPFAEADAERRARAGRARERRQRHRREVAEMEQRSKLFRRWHLEEAAQQGPEALRKAETLIIRTPVPAHIERTSFGEPIFVQYARGWDDVRCESGYCAGLCPKEGRKILVVLTPWGMWCQSCALKMPQLSGDHGKRIRMAERRRFQPRSTTSSKGR
jgi:hypothetical protein